MALVSFSALDDRGSLTLTLVSCVPPYADLTVSFRNVLHLTFSRTSNDQGPYFLDVRWKTISRSTAWRALNWLGYLFDNGGQSGDEFPDNVIDFSFEGAICGRMIAEIIEFQGHQLE
jgi:hypothetical protein